MAGTVRSRELQVAFDGRTVLSGIDLEVPEGKIFALLGPSGCGKTTLLRCMAGLQVPTGGTVQIDGESGKPARLSYVFQEPALLPWRTALDNVRLPLELIGGYERTETRRLAAEQLKAMDLRDEDLTKFPAQLSGGMRMRVSLARALVTDPGVLLLDEPFAALDDMLRTRLCELVLALHARRRRTIVLVTHNIGEAILMSHVVAIMHQGRIGERVTIDLPAERNVEVRGSVEFGRLYREISHRLQGATR